PRPDRRAQSGASGRGRAALRPRVHARRDRRAPRPAARDRELPAAPRPRPHEGDRVKDAQQRTWEVVRRAFEERPPSRRPWAGNGLFIAAVVAALVTATVAAAASPSGR